MQALLTDVACPKDPHAKDSDKMFAKLGAEPWLKEHRNRGEVHPEERRPRVKTSCDENEVIIWEAIRQSCCAGYDSQVNCANVNMSRKTITFVLRMKKKRISSGEFYFRLSDFF